MNIFLKTNTLKTTKDVKDSQIVCVSDLHYTKNIGKELLDRIVVMMIYIKPDYICFLGDLCDDDSYPDVIDWLNQLSKLAPVYFVYGNHDIEKYKINNKTYRVMSSLPADIKHEIQNIDNLTVLKNNKSTIDNNFRFIGTNFFHTTNIEAHVDYMNRNMPNFNDDEFNILLSHNPKIMEPSVFSELHPEYHDNLDVIFSGHTHNGLIPRVFDNVNGNRGLYIKYESLFPDYVRGSFNPSSDSECTGIICPAITSLPDRNNLLKKANEILYKPTLQLVRIKKEN